MTEIGYTELVGYSEKPTRRFIVECRRGIYHTKRCFEYKHDLRRFVEQPNITDIRITVNEEEDVV